MSTAASARKSLLCLVAVGFSMQTLLLAPAAAGAGRAARAARGLGPAL